MSQSRDENPFQACASGHASKQESHSADGHNANNRFFLPEKKKNIYTLNNLNNHFYSNDSKSFHTTQTTIPLIHSK